jgi:hypothetical protein
MCRKALLLLSVRAAVQMIRDQLAAETPFSAGRRAPYMRISADEQA